MPVDDYVLRVAALVAVVAAAMGSGVLLQRRWLSLQGAPAALASALAGYGILVVIGEALGTAGWFARWPLVLTTLLVFGAVRLAIRRVPARNTISRPVEPSHAIESAAPVCLALVLAVVAVSVVAAGRTGVLFIDAIGYHLPIAAHFVTTHHTTGLLHVQAGNGQAYYPDNDELLHAMGLALLGRDSLSLLLGPVAIGLLLLASWCLGDSAGKGPTALVLAATTVVAGGSVAGDAANDWTALWPFLAAAALLVAVPATPARAAFVGVALGLAMGTKLDVLAPGLVLVLVAAFLHRRDGRGLVALVAGAVLTGSYWYVRDAAAVGSPLPGSGLPGLPHVPMSLVDGYGYAIGRELGHPGVLHHFVLPGLAYLFGDAWPVLFVLALVGVVVAVLRGPHPARLLAFVVAAGTVAYLFTPTTGFGPPGRPYLFRYNLRYLWPSLLLALLLLAVHGPRRVTRGLAELAGLATLATALASAGLVWPTDASTRLIVVSVAAALLAVRLALTGPVRRHARAALVATVLVALVAGYPLQQRYLHDRYAAAGAATPAAALYAVAQRLPPARVGVVGLPIYPFEGAQLQRPTAYVGATLPGHAFEDYRSCVAFLSAVARGGFRYVAVGASPAGRNAAGWLRTAGAVPLFTNDAGTVFAPPRGLVRSCGA